MEPLSAFYVRMNGLLLDLAGVSSHISCEISKLKDNLSVLPVERRFQSHFRGVVGTADF